MIKHLKHNDGIETDSGNFNMKAMALSDKCALPKDLRKAECMKCNTFILCRNEFQIRKHKQLEHGFNCDFSRFAIKYGCRVCPDFQTSSISEWNDHFTAPDFSACHGIDRTDTKSVQE